MKRLKIGITAGDFPSVTAALWSSGIAQNIVYLAMLLQRLPQVEAVAVVHISHEARTNPLADHYGLPTLLQAEAVEQLDIIIELGARGGAPEMARLRERGGKLVSYMAGNAMAMNFEAVANKVPYGELLSEVAFDAVWITPQHWRMNRSYCQMTRSAVVECAPHIWHPACLLQSVIGHGAAPFWKPSEGGGARVGVFDPNVNVLKTFHFPLLACEQAYRARPEAVDRVLLFSAHHLIEDPHFKEFCGYLDLGQAGRIFAEGRHPVAEVMGKSIDAVVTHQWENNLNYLYWDILYLGWPLIHNSTEFKDIGYYYPAFDPRAGGEALCEAVASHAANYARTRPDVLQALWAFNIDNPAVQQRYAELIDGVMS